jgi:catechol 2,3-dioxygenase-like lactoylglutathione lyase family enzyme
MSIFDHMTLETGAFDRSSEFYREALAPLGIERLFSAPRPEGQIAGFGQDRPRFFLAEGTTRIGVRHLAFAARGRADVDGFHARALSAGGKDNGAPGLRPRYHEGYYAAFVIDPDGNNVEAVFHDT